MKKVDLKQPSPPIEVKTGDGTNTTVEVEQDHSEAVILERTHNPVDAQIQSKPSSSVRHEAVSKNAAGYGPVGARDLAPLTPMKAWARFSTDPSLANISKGFRALGGALRFSLEEVLRTFEDPSTDANLRAAAEYHLGYFIHADPAHVSASLSQSLIGVGTAERQQRALSQILGWFTTMDAHRGLRLEAIEKLGWIGDAEAEIILRQRIDVDSSEERIAAARAHDRLVERGVLNDTPEPKTLSQQKRALLELLETFTDPAQDAALRHLVGQTLGRFTSVPEWPRRSPGPRELSVTERQRIALDFLLLTLDDPWRDGELMKAVAEKLGWVGDTYSSRVLARFARMVPAAERNAALDAIRRIHERGVLTRSRFTPELFDQKSTDEQLEWLFRNGQIVKTQPLGDAKGMNESNFVLVASTSLADGIEYWALGIYKPATSYRDAGWQYGPAAYEVSKALFADRQNPVPPTYETIINGVPGSVQIIASAEPTKKLMNSQPERLAKLGSSPSVAYQVSDAMVFDRLIENSDRFQSWGDTQTHNVGNYMFDEQDTLLLIDHDLTFGRGLHASFLPDQYNPETVESLQRMREKWPDLAEMLHLYLHPLQAGRTKRAIDEILKDAGS